MFLLLVATHMVSIIAILNYMTVLMHLSSDQSNKTGKYYYEKFCKYGRESRKTKIWTQ